MAALSTLGTERPRSTGAVWLKTYAICTAFFPAAGPVLLILSFLFLLIPDTKL